MATVQLAGCSANWSVYHIPNSFGAMPTAAPVCNGTMIFFEVDASVLTAQTVGQSSNSITNFDYELAAQFWAFGFTVALTLYFTSHVIGLILKFIREN